MNTASPPPHRPLFLVVCAGCVVPTDEILSPKISLLTKISFGAYATTIRANKLESLQPTTCTSQKQTMGNKPCYAIAVALIAAAGGVQGQEFCSCSPTKFEFMLTLDQTCDTNGKSLQTLSLVLVCVFTHHFSYSQ